MAASVVAELAVALGLDASKLESGINTAVNNVRQSLAGMLTQVVAPAVGAFASGELVQQMTDSITKTDRLSKSLGMNIEQLSAWQGAAESAGVEAEEIGETFADFNDWMLDAAVNDSGAMNDFIKNGILPAVKDANGEMKSTEQYILEFSDALHNMDPAEASGLARQIGIGNIEMANFLQQGSGALREQIEEMKRYGVYTEEDAKRAKEFDRAQKALIRTLTMAALPVYRLLATAAARLARFVQQNGYRIRILIPVLAAWAAHATLVAARSFLAAKGITTMSLAMMKVRKAATAAKAFLLSPFGALLAILVIVGLVLDDFLGWLEGRESQFGNFYEKLFGSKENAQAFVDNIKTTIWQITDALAAMSPMMLKVAAGFAVFLGAISILNQVRNVAILLGPILQGAFSLAIPAAVRLFSVLKLGFTGVMMVFEGIRIGLMAVVSGAARFIPLLINGIRAGIMAVMSSTSRFIPLLINGIRMLFAAMGPVGIAFMVIGAAIAYVLANWETFEPIIMAGLEYIGNLAVAVGTAIAESFTAATEWVSSCIDSIVQWVVGLGEHISTTITEVNARWAETWGSIKATAMGVIDAIKGGIGAISNTVTTIFNTVTNIDNSTRNYPHVVDPPAEGQ